MQTGSRRKPAIIGFHLSQQTEIRYNQAMPSLARLCSFLILVLGISTPPSELKAEVRRIPLQAEGSSYAFDAATGSVAANDLSLVRTLGTPTTSNASVATSALPGDPWLYYGYLEDGSERLGRIHLGRMKDEGVFRFLNHDAMHLALSPDGRIFYTDGDGAYEISDRNASGGTFVDPLGQFVAMGTKRLDARLGVIENQRTPLAKPVNALEVRPHPRRSFPTELTL